MASLKQERKQFKMGVEKFGSNPAIGTSEEGVWDSGGAYPWLGTWDANPGVAQVITSTNATDAEGANGMESIHVFGLDENGHPQSEIVTMSGTFTVTTVGLYNMIYRMHGEGVGLNGDTSNAGTISLRPAGGSFTAAIIRPLQGQTQMAMYTIPAGMVGVLNSVYGTSEQSTVNTVQFILRARDGGIGSCWRTRFQIGGGAGRVVERRFPLPIVTFPAGTQIELRAVTTNASGSGVFAGFTIDLTSAG